MTTPYRIPTEKQKPDKIITAKMAQDSVREIEKKLREIDEQNLIDARKNVEKLWLGDIQPQISSAINMCKTEIRLYRFVSGRRPYGQEKAYSGIELIAVDEFATRLGYKTAAAKTDSGTVLVISWKEENNNLEK